MKQTKLFMKKTSNWYRLIKSSLASDNQMSELYKQHEYEIFGQNQFAAMARGGKRPFVWYKTENKGLIFTVTENDLASGNLR